MIKAKGINLLFVRVVLEAFDTGLGIHGARSRTHDHRALDL
jgi:hypothetical protein